MKRALYEYVISGVRTNIPFHLAVLENQRYLKGDLDTGFIDRETGLFADIRGIMDQGEFLGQKLPKALLEKKKIAAIVAATAVSQMQEE